MTTTPQPITDLNEAFGKALLSQFFEPVLAGRDPQGQAFYSPSGVSLLAQALYREHAERIREEVWSRIDMDALASQIAEKVVTDLTAPPDRWTGRNVHQEKLAERVKEIAAQQLGQRVVDAMDLQLGMRALPGDEGDPA